MSDLHELPHRIIDAVGLPGTGLGLTVEQTVGLDHMQLVLVAGEGEREVLACWESPEEATPAPEWAVGVLEVLDLVGHIATHITRGALPDPGCVMW